MAAISLFLESLGVNCNQRIIGGNTDSNLLMKCTYICAKKRIFFLPFLVEGRDMVDCGMYYFSIP